MKVLLLNPLYTQPLSGKHERYFVRSGSRWPHSGVKLRGAVAHYRPFPFSLAYAAAYLKKSTFDVQVIDAVALNIPEEELLRQVAAIKPAVVFYEVTTLTANRDLELAKKIKALTGAKIVAGGAHATYFAFEIIRQNPLIDFIIRGDYEPVLADLIQILEQDKKVVIPGVVYLAGGEVIDLGFPADEKYTQGLIRPLRSIFPSSARPDPKAYWDAFCQNYPALQIQSSRGCRHGCAFCLNSFSGNKPRKYQTAPVDQLCDEIEEAVRKDNIKEFYFDDDDFVQDLRHVDEIFASLRSRKRQIKWSAMASFCSLTPQAVEHLASYGCIGLKLGVESGSDRVLRSMHKAIDLKSAEKIVTSCRRLGIKTHLTFGLGFLDEDPSDIKKTIDYAQFLDIDSVQVSIVTPLPGTEFFETAKARGLLTGIPWENYDGKRISVIYPDGFDNKTLGKVRREFLSKLFKHRILSLAWQLRHLRIILRTLKGWGWVLLYRQLSAIFIDENKNR